MPVIAQEATTGAVLMLAWMNAESFAATAETGRAVYFSRSRNRLWRKGEESGNEQIVREIFIDCDCDAILIKVEQLGGAACHTGHASCFFRKQQPHGWVTVGQPVFDPNLVYPQTGLQPTTEIQQ